LRPTLRLAQRNPRGNLGVSWNIIWASDSAIRRLGVEHQDESA